MVKSPKSTADMKDSYRTNTKDRHTFLSWIWDLTTFCRWSLALGLLLIVINRALGMVAPGSTKYLVDEVIAKRNTHLLVPLVVIVMAAYVLQAATSAAVNQILSKSAHRLMADLRRKVQAHLISLPLRYHDANSAGSLVTRVMTDVDGVGNLIGMGLLELVGSFIGAAAAFWIMLSIDPLLTSMASAILIAFGVVFRRGLLRILPVSRKRGQIYAELTGRLTECLGGIRVVKGYHAEEHETTRFSAGTQSLMENAFQHVDAKTQLNRSVSLVLGLLVVSVTYVGALKIVSGSLSLGDFLTFVALLVFLKAPVVEFVAFNPALCDAIAGLERAFQVLVESPEDVDLRRTVVLQRICRGIRFDSVNFAYEAGRTVLNDISFEAPRGTMTALVGSSGSGKSTLIGLLAAFYAPSAGRILVDDVDLSTVTLSSYRSQLGVVLQNTFLFDGTIRDNVTFARPDASQHEFLQACRIAGVCEFAEGLERKYETEVGERGVKLSGGQSQRVSIARAILADPSILLLDEPTSNLDSQSETSVRLGLAHLLQGRTTLVIAHRLSTIVRADQILVIEGGRIVERGTHASLYRAGGRYHALYAQQCGVNLRVTSARTR